MTHPTGPAESRHHIVIVGAEARGRCVRDALLAAGVTDFAILEDEVLSSVFDDDTGTWVLTTAAGETTQADVVIAAHQGMQVPWIPDIAGRNDFLGESFHAAAIDPDFDSAGKHIAVVGTDAAAGHYLGLLVGSAASVTVFAHAPRRVVTEIPLVTTRARRWLRRHTRGEPRPAARLAGSAIAAVIPSGIRTSDGVDHRADAIIYGTGFAMPDRISDTALLGARGQSIRQAWADGMEPFLGVAVRGFPNYFFLAGPDVNVQARYVVECLKLMKRTESTRIEVRYSTQQVFNERAHLTPAQPHPVASAFDLSSSAPEDEDTYDGAATLEIAGVRRPVRVRLTGHLDPIDGNYHWQGTVLDPLPQDSLKQVRTATLSVGRRCAPARIVEQTPWGTHSVAGVGAPPYARPSR